jgi:anti-anti-sigma regulatory factor
MSVKRDALAFKVPGKVLGTRALGREVAEQLRERAGDGAQDLFVEFTGVQVASSPFLDELALALRAWNADHPDRFVVLTNLNEDVQDTLGLVLERRDMMLVAVEKGTLRLSSLSSWNSSFQTFISVSSRCRPPARSCACALTEPRSVPSCSPHRSPTSSLPAPSCRGGP